jgi:hypothetical protein
LSLALVCGNAHAALRLGGAQPEPSSEEDAHHPVKSIKPVTRVNFTIEQQPGGMYEIQAIAPAGGSR